MSIERVETSVVETTNNPANNQNNEEKYEKEAVRRLIRRLDRRIIPFVFVLEMGSYINRISIGHAKLMGMKTDLNLSQSDSNWSISVFFLVYLIFEIPGSLFMRYLGPTRYLSLSILAWGAISVGTAFINNAQELLTVRCLLGIAQAGFFPGMIIYFSLWYRKRDHTMRIAILFGAAILSGALGSILAYGFRHMGGICGLKGWQWMYLIEGLPMIPLAVITCLFLNNIPNSVQWLNITEKMLLTNLLRKDQGRTDWENDQFSWNEVFSVFLNWKIYIYGLINIAVSGQVKYLATYLPLLVQDISQSEARVHLIAAPPYVFAFVCCLLISYSSSRRNEHAFHLIFSQFIALIGFILSVTLINRGNAALYVSTCIACSGVFSSLPLLISWLTNNIDGLTKKSIAVGFVLALGQIGGIIFPLISYEKSAFQRNNFICIGSISASLLLTIILWICLNFKNHWRVPDREELSKYESSIEDRPVEH